MSDTDQVRRKVRQARELMQQGKTAQAKSLLKGVKHPKAADLLTQIDATASVRFQPGKTRKLPLLVAGGTLALLMLVVGSVLLISMSKQRSRENNETLPTLMPTSDCTHETVQTWWQTQDEALTGFAADASSASRTMPGQPLNEQINHLRDFRTNFPVVPDCANPDTRQAVDEVVDAIDATIITAERWNNEQIDGTQATHEFDTAESALSEAKAHIRLLLKR